MKCDYRFEHDAATDRPTGSRCTNDATHQILWEDGRRYSFACADHLEIHPSASVKPFSIESFCRSCQHPASHHRTGEHRAIFLAPTRCAYKQNPSDAECPCQLHRSVVLSPRYKVWTIDPDGEPGTLLLRTGSSETSDADVPFAGVTPAEVAKFARERLGVASRVVVKDFDTDAWHTVLEDGTVLDGKVSA